MGFGTLQSFINSNEKTRNHKLPKSKIWDISMQSRSPLPLVGFLVIILFLMDFSHISG